MIDESLRALVDRSGNLQELIRPLQGPLNDPRPDDDFLNAIGLDDERLRLLTHAISVAGRVQNIRWNWVRGPSDKSPMELTAWTTGPRSTDPIEMHIQVGKPELMTPPRHPQDVSASDFRDAVIDIADAGALGFAILNNAGGWRLEWLNHGGADLLGQPRERLIGGPPVPIDPARWQGRQHMTEHVISWVKPGGQLIRLGVRMSMGDVRGKPRIFLFFRDVTQEETDRDAVERTSRRLRIANENLTIYAAALGHDLRAPLRSISYNIDMRSRDKDRSPEKDAELTKGIKQQVERMNHIINGLVDCIQVQDVLDPKPVDLNKILHDVQAELEMAILENDARITADDLPEVMGDATRLMRLFSNLLGNALKYRGEDAPHIRITAQTDALDWRIGVHDNGKGFTNEEAQSMFELFRRGDDLDAPGSGIGLALCKRVVEAHGGRMWAEGVPGRGSSFWFTLPGVQSQHYSRADA